MNHRAGLIIGLALFALVLLLPVPDGMDPRGMRVLAIVCLTATFWVTEALPIPVASLLPAALFPLLSIMDANAASSAYTNYLIFLFFGGFFLALTLEKWNLHRRIALFVLSLFGTKPSSMILGMMVAVAMLSMWISNTATALTMFPICLAIIDQLKEQGVDKAELRKFSTALLLGVAYAANVGGMGTPIGTAPNGVFLERLGDDAPSFAQWMMLGFPLVIVFGGIIWFVLTRFLFRFPPGLEMGSRDLVKGRLKALGPMSREERAVLVVFVATVILWVTREDPFGGWGGLAESLGLTWISDGKAGQKDSTVALFAVIALCLIRVRKGGPPLADWTLTKKLPWGVLFLLGGGFCIAQGFEVKAEGMDSLSEYIGHRLEGLDHLSLPMLVLVTCLLMTFLTELTSNTATTNVMLPILAAIGTGSTGNMLCLAATLSASCAFMLPVATPPNAIVFASNRFTIKDMARAGFVINLIGAVIITLFVLLLGESALGL